MSGTERPARIELMDALRGLAVCLMVLHHFLYDLCAFLGAPWWLFTNPVFDVLHYFFAGLFIFLSGISSDFSRSNLKRGAKAMAIALGITLVTYFMDMTIVFGVLHLLASCMLLFGLTRGFWEALPAWVLPVLCLALIFLTAPCADGVTTQTPQLWLFGFTTPRLRLGGLFPAAAVVLRVPARHLGRALCQGGPPAAVVLHSQSASPRPRRASRACPLRSASALALCAHHAAPAHFYPIGGPRCTTERSKTATLPTARASA